jgi:predicted HAD superfamily Cof-like phosphohydrolase
MLWARHIEKQKLRIERRTNTIEKIGENSKRIKRKVIMSDWLNDIKNMYDKYGFQSIIDEMDGETLRKYLEFRIQFLQEEIDELFEASGMVTYEKINKEEVVDALIDIMVVAIGTLATLKIDADKAWGEVLKANMNKMVGVKLNRPNPLGLPDLCKPDSWTPPSHNGNYGLLEKIDE